MTKPELLVKLPDREPEAYKSQNDAKAAVMAGQNFGITYLLTRVRTFAPYSNYSVPDDLDAFEFTVKGVVRLEMLADSAFRSQRRLFGSVFTRRKTGEKYTWRSRAAVKAFDGLPAVEAFLARDPLQAWPGNRRLSIPQESPAGEDWYLLWQVQDVELPGGQRFADVLEAFFNGHSELLALVARADIVPPV